MRRIFTDDEKTWTTISGVYKRIYIGNLTEQSLLGRWYHRKKKVKWIVLREEKSRSFDNNKEKGKCPYGKKKIEEKHTYS